MDYQAKPWIRGENRPLVWLKPLADNLIEVANFFKIRTDYLVEVSLDWSDRPPSVRSIWAM